MGRLFKNESFWLTVHKGRRFGGGIHIDQNLPQQLCLLDNLPQEPNCTLPAWRSCSHIYPLLLPLPWNRPLSLLEVLHTKRECNIRNYGYDFGLKRFSSESELLMSQNCHILDETKRMAGPAAMALIMDTERIENRQVLQIWMKEEEEDECSSERCSDTGCYL